MNPSKDKPDDVSIGQEQGGQRQDQDSRRQRPPRPDEQDPAADQPQRTPQRPDEERVVDDDEKRQQGPKEQGR